MEAVEQKKEPKLAILRLQTVFLGLILVIVLGVGFLAVREFRSLHRSLALVEQEVEALEMDRVNGAVEALTAAAENLSRVDVAELNATAGSLKEAADNLSQVDMDALNKLVASLTTVAEKLEKTVNSITGIFGR